VQIYEIFVMYFLRWGVKQEWSGKKQDIS